MMNPIYAAALVFAALLIGGAALYFAGRRDERAAICRRGHLRAEGLLAKKRTAWEHEPEFYRERFREMRNAIPVDDAEIARAKSVNHCPRTPRAKLLQRP